MDKLHLDLPSAPSRDLGSLVTVIVVPRHRFGLTGQCIASLDANTPEGVRMVYVDAGSPAYVVEELRNRFAEERLSIVSTGRYMAPNEARNAGAVGVQTRYLAFVDNDILVQPDWLRHLVDCADTTGADAVDPLTLIGIGGQKFVHFCGGNLSVTKCGRKRRFSAVFEQPVTMPYSVKLRSRLARRSTGFVEFHCILVRLKTLRAIGMLGEDLPSVHDHYDFSLTVLERGGKMYVEPESVVSYLSDGSDGDWVASDLPYYCLRWGETWTQTSIDRFYRKRGYLPDDEYDLSVEWARRQRGLMGVHHPDAASEPAPVPPPPPPQTNVELYRQLGALRFRESELALVRDTYDFAASMFGGMLRASGRPFLNHLVSTAGLLAARKAAPSMIAAALIHALYEQSALGRVSAPTGSALRNLVRERFGAAVEDVLHRYAQLEALKNAWPDADPDRCDLTTAKAIAIRVANDLDDYLSGEFAYSVKRPNPIARRGGDYAAAVAGLLGFGDLAAQLLDAAAAEAEPVAPVLRSDRAASFYADEGAADTATATALLRSARRHAGDAFTILAVRLPRRAAAALLGCITQSQTWIVPRIVVRKLLTDPRWLAERVGRRAARLWQRAKAPPHA